MVIRSVTVGKLSQLGLLALALVVTGCHASSDDPAGQAKELADPVRREHAISNLTRIYASTLSTKGGDRRSTEVSQLADTIVEPLTRTYLEHPEDNRNGRLILDLLYEIRDPRALPALIKALDWRPEVNEEHAIRAARTLRVIQVPADRKAEVTKALAESLDRVSQPRPVDNRMRKEFIDALGAVGGEQAVPFLLEVIASEEESQNFLFKRLAMQQLARIGDPSSVPVLIKALFMYDKTNPRLRMNDVAAEALVAVGRPALKPLLDVAHGRNPEVVALVQQYIAAVRAAAPQVAAGMTPASIMTMEASYALGELGMREAMPLLLAETKHADEGRRLAAVTALVRLNRQGPDNAAISESLRQVYAQAQKEHRPQLIAAMQHMVEPSLLSFLLAEAQREETELPQLRVTALRAYILLANQAEGQAAEALIRAEPGPQDGGFRATFEKDNQAALDAIKSCDTNVACWIKKLEANDPTVVAKAAYMLARYGRGNAQALSALVKKLAHPSADVRADILYVIDYVAVGGSAEAVNRISELQESEQGRASWNQIRSLAQLTQARLKSRAS